MIATRRSNELINIQRMSQTVKRRKVIESVSRRLLNALPHKTAASKLIVAVVVQAFEDCIEVARFKFMRGSNSMKADDAISAVQLCSGNGGHLVSSLGIDAEYFADLMNDRRLSDFIGMDRPIPQKAMAALIVRGLLDSEGNRLEQ